MRRDDSHTPSTSTTPVYCSVAVRSSRTKNGWPRSGSGTSRPSRSLCTMRPYIVGGIAVKRASILVTSAVIMLAVAALATAATAPAPTTQPAVFAIQAKVLQVGPGWVQVQVVKVQQGSGLRANAKLRIHETAKTKSHADGQGFVREGP